MDLELKNYRECMNEAGEYYEFLQKEGYTPEEALWIVYKNLGKIEESIIKK